LSSPVIASLSSKPRVALSEAEAQAPQRDGRDRGSPFDGAQGETKGPSTSSG
jgi:hypothetical protein